MTNESLVENTPPPVASYASHVLEVDKERDVEIVDEKALAGHRVNPQEAYLTHESESLTRNASPALKQPPLLLLLLLLAVTVACLGASACG